MLRTRIVLMLILLVFVAAMNLSCATRVDPPRSVADPVAVYIVDYGRHGSLLLPLEQPLPGSVDRIAMREYSFGDWVYYAKGKNSISNGAAALLWETEGSLGRRDLPDLGPAYDEAPIEPAARIERNMGVQRVHPVVVEREAAEELLAMLDARFEARAEGVPPLRNERFELDFVMTEESYSLLNQCNHAIRDWMNELGADAYGAPLISEFKILESGQTADQHPDRP